jgi:uncharacterized protein YjbI with pentapeptide repeats
MYAPLLQASQRIRAAWQKLQEDSARPTRRKLSALFFWALLIFSVCIGLWVLDRLPRWEVDRLPQVALSRDPSTDIRRLELENEQRKTLSSIVLGVLGLFALFLTWRRVRAGDRQVEVAEQGHLTDRFTKAIEQLGKVEDKEPNLEVRLGGIYALERIAYDSPRDHWTIMEVLTAYVRRNAALEQLSTGNGTTAQDGAQEPHDGTDSSLQNVKLRVDIQAILTVLGRREQSYRRERDRKLVLSQTALQGADFQGARLQGAHFQGARLQGANFGEAQLQGADFQGARLQGAIFRRARLQGAHFQGARLQGANFARAQLQEAYFGEARLQGAIFGEARLQGAIFGEAQLQKAMFLNAQLQETNLWGAEGLTHEQLAVAHLENTSLPEYLLDKDRRIQVNQEQEKEKAARAE